MINRALTCALVMALILASFALAKKTDDPDDDYFRVRDRQTSDSRTSAVVNPKKSPLPVGTRPPIAKVAQKREVSKKRSFVPFPLAS